MVRKIIDGMKRFAGGKEKMPESPFVDRGQMASALAKDLMPEGFDKKEQNEIAEDLRVALDILDKEKALKDQSRSNRRGLMDEVLQGLV